MLNVYTSLITSVLLGISSNLQSHLPAGYCEQLFEPSMTSFAAPLDSIEDFIISEMETYSVPGLAACIVHDDQVIWSFAHGYQRVQPEIQAGDSTLFMMASISKTFTGAAILQLREDGLLELTDPVNDHLTNLQVFNPFYPDSVITIWNLLTHTSSLKDNWGVMESLYVLGDSPIPLGEYLFDYFDPTGIYYNQNSNFYNIPPGEEYHYCNEAYALLGFAVEEITGMPFDEYSNQYLFDPMGMYETSWFIADLDTNHVAMPYQWTGGHWEPYGYYGYPDYPCGQMRTSSLQLAQMLIAYLNNGLVNGYQMLDSATIAEVTTLQCPDLNDEMGLTWFRCLRGSHIVWMHTGGDYGVNTAYGFMPLEDTGVVLLLNKSGSTCLSSVFLALLDYAESLTGIGEEEPGVGVADVLEVLPNPCRESARIELELRSNGYTEIVIYDMAGHRVLIPLPVSYVHAGSHSLSIDLSDLPQGVLFIQLKSAQGTSSIRLVHLN